MKSIVVNVMPEETRMAIVDGRELIGLELERPKHSHLVGNIYKGVVQNVLPGMQAAFVDIGKSKNAFLFVGDGTAEGKGGKRQKIHVGQSLPVQITKDEVGTKGPRATLHLTLPGRYVVLMPHSAYIGTSHRIASEEERSRLYDIAQKACPKGMGIILRTVAEGQPAEIIQQDINYLVKLWASIEAKFKVVHGENLLYRDADLVIRIVRDIFNEEIGEMVIDNQQVYQQVAALVQDITPEWVQRIHYYEGSNIFKEYGITDELARLEERNVELKSGGFLVIDKTEALTVIDVNTGSFVGDINLADTAYALNLEAAEEIMKQLRLRDIGGMIIIDFIDMAKESHKEGLLNKLRELAQTDRVKTNVLDITALGLVEITRKKSRHNLEHFLHETCPVCQGTGNVLSAETLGVKICREIRRIEKRKHCSDGYHLQMHSQAANELSLSRFFSGIEKELGIRIRIEASKEIKPSSFILTQK